MTTATKQTAANNAILANIKKQMNGPIFKKASEMMNNGGEAACRAYMGQFFNDEARERVLANFGFMAPAAQ